ncbi:pilus assembly protein TadG-related protein [Halomonas sp. HG01]|uniref:pilus assembly protein TadG-related protein n=1 Tax=Halomonas sp. HG01 TaxID=1609967 RepID=UPI0009E49DE3|nr:pilus assembly protein TadG-related protein [Halomonas sp. HG01]
MTPHGFHSPRRQRGVIGLLGAIVMMLVAVCIALALDTGRLYMEKRNLQRVADLAALSVASRCETLSSCDQAVIYAQDVLADNGYARELVDSDGITLGRVALVDVAIEGVGTPYRRYDFDDSLPQDAVQIVLEDSVSPPLMAAFMPDDGDAIDGHTITLQSTAVARKTSYVAFSVGSRLASLDSSESSLLAPLLGGLLGSDVPLSLVGYEGVLDTRITLLELASEMPGPGVDLSALTVDEVLNTSVTLSELLEVSESVLSDRGLLASDLALLDEMQGAMSLDVGTADINLGELIDIRSAEGVDDTEALKAGVRLGDLLGTSLLLANEGSAISLKDLDVDLTAVTANVDLTVIQAPHIAVGPIGCTDGDACDGSNWKTTGKTAQLGLDAMFDINLLGVLNLHLSLDDIAAAQAQAGVESIAASDSGYDIGVGAVVQPLAVDDIGVSVEVLEAFDGLINVALENASTTTVNGGGSGYETQVISGWPDADSADFVSGASGVTSAVSSLLTSLELKVSLGPDADQCNGNWLCELTSGLLGPINDILGSTLDSISDLGEALALALSDVVNPLVDDVIDPLLLDAMGLGIGEAEVRVIEVSSSGVELVQ